MKSRGWGGGTGKRDWLGKNGLEPEARDTEGTGLRNRGWAGGTGDRDCLAKKNRLGRGARNRGGTGLRQRQEQGRGS